MAAGLGPGLVSISPPVLPVVVAQALLPPPHPPPDGQVAWQWAYSAFGDEQPTLGAKRFTNETTNTTTGTTPIPDGALQPALPGEVPRQGERPWIRQLNAPEGAVIAVPGKA